LRLDEVIDSHLTFMLIPMLLSLAAPMKILYLDAAQIHQSVPALERQG